MRSEHYPRVDVLELCYPEPLLNRLDDLQSKTHERDHDLVSIVVPVHGNLTITNNCLESIYWNLPNRKFEIILVNNKSDDATRANIVLWQQARSNIKVVSNWTNLNFALGCNIGFAHSQGGTVIFLNNDTLVTPGWLDRLVDELIDPTIGAVQPKLSTRTVRCSRSGPSSRMWGRSPTCSTEVNRGTRGM